MNIELGQVISQIISFLVMVWVLKRYAWRPLLDLLDERKNMIQSDFDLIEERKKELERLDSEYRDKLAHADVEAAKKMELSIEEGKRIAGDIQKEAQMQAKSMLVKVQEDAEKEVSKAKSKLKSELIDISIAASQKILEANLDPESQKKLIDKFIEECTINDGYPN